MRQRGAINIGCLILLAIIVVGFYHAYEFGKHYYAKSGLEEKLYELQESVFRQSEENVAKAVIKTAAEYGVTLTPKNVYYNEVGSEATLEVNYTVTVETFLIKRVLRFRIVSIRRFSR